MTEAGLVEIVRHADLAAAGAALVAEAAPWLGTCARQRPASAALPGGRSPMAMIAALGRCDLCWPSITLTTTDERRVAVDHALSNARMVRHALAGTAAAARFVPLAGPAAAQAIAQPFDLVVLGMGADGHIASLFPGQPLDRPGLPPLLAADPDPLPPEAPVGRWTWSLSALAAARRTLLLIGGADKRAVLDRALHHDAELPVGALLRRARGPVTIHWGER